jgi:hypothetical protein
MKVRILTLEQKEQITGQMYAPDSFFNPIQDADGNWIISNEEVDQCTHEGTNEWIHDLPEIDYNPVAVELPFGLN